MHPTPHTDAYRIVIEELIAAREAQGLTQSDLATALGQAPSYIEAIETGAHRVDAVELVLLCQHLKVDMPQLICRLQKALDQSPD